MELNDTAQIVDYIVGCLDLDERAAAVQRIQTSHRLELARFWGVEKGARILEIGCGQGDTSAVLAFLVGEEGLVTAVDNASPDYGSPFTLGEMATRLKNTPFGKQLDIRFETDILSPEVDFPENSFDLVIFANCSWYFKSAEELQKLLAKVRKWGKRLGFAEWDTRLTRAEQFPHFLAISIQAQYECFKENSKSNVRTLFTPEDLREIAGQAGWQISREASLPTVGLQDAKWEIDITLEDYEDELDRLGEIPAKLKIHLISQVKLLKEVSQNGVETLPTFIFLAEWRARNGKRTPGFAS